MNDNSQIIDITLAMNDEMLLYPGDSPPCLRQLSSIANGASLTTSGITMGCHVGTHVDAPSHFIEGGKNLGELSLEHFAGEAQVIELSSHEAILLEDVANLPIRACRHVLLKTRNSKLLHQQKFDPTFCHLTPEAAENLLLSKPLSIGFDYYSLDPPSVLDFPSHRIFAHFGIPVFVCLDLSNVTTGIYKLIALPLKIDGIEGSPVRAILLR